MFVLTKNDEKCSARHDSKYSGSCLLNSSRPEGVGWELISPHLVLIGNQGDETLEIENLAEELGTIPYELLTGLNQRIPRIYHKLELDPSTAQKV